MIGASLSVIILAGVLSAFLMLGRSGMSVANYSTSEAEIRRAIEEFSQDIRMASAIAWNSDTSITLTVPDNYATNANKVTYAFDSGAGSFYRRPGDAASTANATTFVRSISSFQFRRFDRLGANADNDDETKCVAVQMNVRRAATTLVAGNTSLISASFILRNKAVN